VTNPQKNEDDRKSTITHPIARADIVHGQSEINHVVKKANAK
jgi:hypothetical protein